HSGEVVGRTWTSRRLRRALTPGWAVLRVVARASLLILLATCQVDKLTNTPPPIATLSVAPDQVSDSAAVGSMSVNHDSLAVVNTGPGTLSWSHGSPIASRPLPGSAPGWALPSAPPAWRTGPGAPTSGERPAELESRRPFVC